MDKVFSPATAKGQAHLDEEFARGKAVKNSNEILLGDCIEGMRDLPDNSFDVAIADPPYNVSKGGNWSWAVSYTHLTLPTILLV